MYHQGAGWRIWLVVGILSVMSCSGDGGSDPGDEDGDGVVAGEDCDDGNPNIYPGATEIAYDGVDQDCDGGDLVDVDGDGYAAVEAGGNDCNDEDPQIGPREDEIPYDGVDQNCDGEDVTDVDGDGYVGEDGGGDDCDDEDPFVYPGAVEIPYDRTDQDCDGEDLTDVDGDGYDGRRAGGDDCNDLDETINPAAEEVCDEERVDHDCDGEEAINEEVCFLYPAAGTWRSASGDIEFVVQPGGQSLTLIKAYLGTCSMNGCVAEASLTNISGVEIFNSYGLANFFVSGLDLGDCWGTFYSETTAEGYCDISESICGCTDWYDWSATLSL